jgi:predicted nucleotidyltransferase
VDTELVERLKVAAREAFADEPVEFAYLFGSRAHGRPRPDSDTDIAVLLEDGLTASERFEFSLREPSPLRGAAGTQKDLVVLNDAPFPLLGRILQHHVVLYSRNESLRIEYESRNLRLFWEFEPRLVAMARAYLAGVARGDF